MRRLRTFCSPSLSHFRTTSLVGSYVFGDYCSGRLFAFNADDALAGRPVTAVQVGQVPFSISSFGEDEAGELYVVDLSGAIYRLVASS